MPAIPVIAVFDIGKTNKKLLLFDEDYRIVYQEEKQFAETKDEDGFPCEDLAQLSCWVKYSYEKLLLFEAYVVMAVNFSGYGASFVHLGSNGKPVAPLYNYLKPFPAALQEKFHQAYGEKEAFSLETASPVLGNLNSGMQLYWLKHCKPQLFEQVACALHLPQYLSFLITGKAYSDITSVGCHTSLWNFNKMEYHRWVKTEGVYPKLAPFHKCNDAINVQVSGNRHLQVGIGLHDSSAALIPYLLYFKKPFVLLSTGTWCISLNPFNAQPLSEEELMQDCLCYLTYEGVPVKAARVFAGYEHEQQVKRIATHFGISSDFYNDVEFNAETYVRIKQEQSFADATGLCENTLKQSAFAGREISKYNTAIEAYHQLMFDLVHMQYRSTALLLTDSSVKQIFVDGGFSKNKIYMNGLAAAFPGIEVYAASMAQASALGAALVLHEHWNAKPIPSSIIEVEHYH